MRGRGRGRWQGIGRTVNWITVVNSSVTSKGKQAGHHPQAPSKRGIRIPSPPHQVFVTASAVLHLIAYWGGMGGRKRGGANRAPRAAPREPVPWGCCCLSQSYSGNSSSCLHCANNTLSNITIALRTFGSLRLLSPCVGGLLLFWQVEILHFLNADGGCK